MNAPRVSIIMPLYNSRDYVGEAIGSILRQTFMDWHLTIVDDCSTDDSVAVVERYLDDDRIELIRCDENHGAAEARNLAIRRAPKGKYLAYIDADDLWLPEKLERQIGFMEEANAAMCFTSYETIAPDGRHRNYVHVPVKIDYRGFLKNTITCSHTIAFDLDQVDWQWLLVDKALRAFDFPEDMCAWCSVLKRGYDALGLDVILAQNRKHPTSRSANKLNAIKRTWSQYRRIEGLSLPYAAYCLSWQLFHAVLKRI